MCGQLPSLAITFSRSIVSVFPTMSSSVLGRCCEQRMRIVEWVLGRSGREERQLHQRGCRLHWPISRCRHTFSTLQARRTGVVSALSAAPRRNETREARDGPRQLVLDGLVLLRLFALVGSRRGRELQLLVHAERVEGRMSRGEARRRGLATATTTLVSSGAVSGL